MNKTHISFLLLFVFLHSFAQQKISGKVMNKKKPIAGANIYIEDTFIGTTSDINGVFELELEEKMDSIELVISYVGYKEARQVQTSPFSKKIIIQLRKDNSLLGTVTLSAGKLNAGDNSAVAVLDPMDIVTTSSALGSVVGAIQTLPGTNKNSLDGRLFVRGGRAEETSIYIDGLKVFQPYSNSTPGTPVRSRYSPFLFKGVSFSTGGYSSEFDQALSGILEMNTLDDIGESEYNIGLMTLGAQLGVNQKIDSTQFLSLSTSYINFTPYTAIATDRNVYHKAPQGGAGELSYRNILNKKATLKAFVAYEKFDLDITSPHINYENGYNTALNSQNFYANSSLTYGHKTGDWFLGTAIGNATNHFDINDFEFSVKTKDLHLKTYYNSKVAHFLKLDIGAEYFNHKLDYSSTFIPNVPQLTNEQVGVFSNFQWTVTPNFAIHTGYRGTRYSQLNEWKFHPRVSLAYRLPDASQIGIASGIYAQNPSDELLGVNQNLEPEEAKHFMINYFKKKNNKLIRLEAYYKDYNKLYTYQNGANGINNIVLDGNGYAKGIDLYWRDRETIKNTDYWISYSLVDTKRFSDDFPQRATPNFAPAHNLSIVSKYFVTKWKSSINVDFNYASGRPYTDPNLGGFLDQKTPSYQSLNLGWAYLLSEQKILYFSVQNILGRKNVFDYRYGNQLNNNDLFPNEAIVPAADRFFFIGFFWTISRDKTKNQLDNL